MLVSPGQGIFEEFDGVLALDLLPLHNVSKNVFVSLDDQARIGLPVNQLLVSVSLDPFQKGVNLFLLMLSQLGFLLLYFLVDLLLVHLDLNDLHLVCHLTDLVSIKVLLNSEMFSFKSSHMATLSGEGEGMVALEHAGSQLYSVDIVLVSHLLEAQVGRTLVLLHILVPGLRELNELLSLDSLNLLKLKMLSVLHLSDQSLKLYGCYLFVLGLQDVDHFVLLIFFL